jgi:KRAB domain-containing zinc finger protein
MDVSAPQKQASIVTDVKNVEKEYKCLECGKIFSNYHYLYNHKKMHEGKIYRYVQCPSTYKSKNGLKYHLRSVHELRPFEFHHCQTIFKTKATLKSHMSMHFNSIVYPCNLCSEIFNTKNMLAYHLNIAHSLEKYECYYCSQTYKSKKYLLSHLKICYELIVGNINYVKVPGSLKNVNEKYKCSKCSKMFKTIATFRTHAKVHVVKFCCNQCKAEYRSRGGLNYHLKTQHKMNHFECYHCAKIFETKMSLILHMVTHSKKIQCNECSAIFKNYYKFEKHLKEIHCLNSHIISHQSPKEKYPCRDCPKIFNSISDLSAHMLEQCFAEGF